MIHPLFAWLYWDPERVVFTVPLIERPIVWYGLWFVFGFIVGYFLLVYMFQKTLQPRFGNASRNLAYALIDRMTWFVVCGTLIGARLGHVFFYDWPRYAAHPLDILKIWEGGLASHGGTIGIMIAIFCYQRLFCKPYPELSFLKILDLFSVPTAFGACCIRIGNFTNQEILGTPTNLPWAIIFGHPADGSAPVPRHPAQLYEAVVYLGIFILLYYLWRYRSEKLRPGVLLGTFFVLTFASRFFIEFIKNPQSLVIDESLLQMGQYLSIPFIALGIILILFGKNLNRHL